MTFELSAEVAARWPSAKVALFRVVTGENLNDGHYVNAYTLTDKLHDALVENDRLILWDIEEYKVWKGIDPEKPVWASRGFCCQSWGEANELLEYLQHNSPGLIARVARNKVAL